ncbi:MAG TPA: hemerythrin domain-containing protein [Gammaproteobacteria bacterium]|nr:hemerythrin domain-containing protein [Gammaproteobacteria bacterium]
MSASDAIAPDFQHPLALLQACHERMERFATLAVRIGDHLDEAGTPATAAAGSAERVLRYFDQAAPQHHADEERDLLPRLRGRLAEPASPELAQLLGGLAGEHQALDAQWTALRPALVALTEGRAVPAADYRARAAAFQEAQLDHVARENRWLLPACEAHLTAPDWAAIGAAMAHRRGVGQNTEAAAEESP